MDTELMAYEELSKELDVFYDFVGITGHQYLNEEGNIRFNALRAEWVRRREIEEAAKGVRIPPGLGVSSSLDKMG